MLLAQFSLELLPLLQQQPRPQLQDLLLLQPQPPARVPLHLVPHSQRLRLPARKYLHLARLHPIRTQPLLHLEALPWAIQFPLLLLLPHSQPATLESHLLKPQQLRQLLVPQQRRQSHLLLEAAEHHPHLLLTPPQLLSTLGQLLPPQQPLLGPRLNQHLEPALLVLLSAALPLPQLHPQLHQVSVQQPRLRAPPHPPSDLAVQLLSRLPLDQLSQHPVDLTLALECRALSLEHQFPIILHHRWEASTLGLLLQTNQLLERQHHLLARVLLQVQFPLEVLELHSKASMLFSLDLQQLLPSQSELDRNHPEHGRGCRRGDNTTGRSSLPRCSNNAFGGLQLLLLWLTWLTLLCSKPNIPPHQATTIPYASSLSSSSGLCWPEVCR